MLDLLLKGGLVFDGTGAPPWRGDVGIAAGLVAQLAPRIQADAREVRDAAGLWVTPGFIDIHTHYDVEVEIAPGLAESVRHGVTSVVMGNCSLSRMRRAPSSSACARSPRRRSTPAASASPSTWCTGTR